MIRSVNSNHEVDTCQSVVALMNQRKGESIQIVGRPDEAERQKQAVDFFAKGKFSDYVLEHTTIESYPNQIADDHQFNKLIVPLMDILTQKVSSPGEYTLMVEIGAVQGATNTKQIQEAIIPWVIKKAPTLSVGNPPHHMVKEKPSGVPFDVTLYRFTKIGNKFRVVRGVPDDEKREELRSKRMVKALVDKCQKLKAAKMQTTGRQSVLILQTDDLALANHVAIGRALLSASGSSSVEMPDEVYLKECGLFFVLKDGDQSFPNVSNMGPFNP